MSTCDKKDEAPAIIVTTDQVIVTDSIIYLRATIASVNGRHIESYGFALDENNDLTYAPLRGIGSTNNDIQYEEKLITSALSDSTYYFRAYCSYEGEVIFGETMSFSKRTPTVITGLSPSTAIWGDTITIAGLNFSTIPSENLIKFGDIEAPCISSTRQKLEVVIPATVSRKVSEVSVRLKNKKTLSPVDFTLASPVINSFSPVYGNANTEITINGNYFKDGITSVKLGGMDATIRSISRNIMLVAAPVGLEPGPSEITVSVGAEKTVAASTFNFYDLLISSISPLEATYGDVITIKGSGFGNDTEKISVKFGIVDAAVTASGNNFVKAVVPAEVDVRQVQISVVKDPYVLTTSQEFFTLREPLITGFTPVNGTFQSLVSISGENFNPLLTENSVTFGEVAATVVEASAHELKVLVPDNYSSETGLSRITVTTAGATITSASDFELDVHTVISFTPGEGARGTAVTIQGQNFNPVESLNKVFIGQAEAEITSASSTMLTCIVPMQVTAGDADVHVIVGGRDIVASSPFHVLDPWLKKSDLNGGGRKYPISFVIGNKGYAGGGIDEYGNSKMDFYMYDPTSDTWSKKADLPVSGVGMRSFSTTGKGYIIYNKELWQYNATTNQWLKKADFPGEGIIAQSTFAIGNKGYVGTGNWTNWGNRTSEFFEYNEALNQWTPKANFGGGELAWGAGFSIGDKGYIATGTWTMRDLWQYDPTTNQWTKKMSLTGKVQGMNNQRIYAVGISGNQKGYFGTGDDGNYSPESYFADLYEYDPAANTLKRLVDMPGSPRAHAFGFQIDNKIYIGAGGGSGYSEVFSDFYQCTPQ